MKRLHVHVSAKDLSTSIRFYRELFNADPVVTKGDYAKWMLEEKSWIEDPQGVEWETFLTTGESTVYGIDVITPRAAKACCTPNRAM
jgi:catechol 2,3-dioxygenase-like lactoylglutathione lyase family enzyme